MSHHTSSIRNSQPCATDGCEGLTRGGHGELCRRCSEERRLSGITEICLGFDGPCERIATHKAHQLCSPCYERFRAIFRKTPYLCAFEGGCSYPRRHQVPRPGDRGLCIVHDDEYISEHPPEPPALRWCEAENGRGAPCERLTMNGVQPWCKGHYDRWNKYGDVLNDKPLRVSHPRGTVPCSYKYEDGSICTEAAIYTSDPPWCARHYAANNRPEKTGKCPECGKSILETSDRCQPCYVKNRTGPNHPNWKGGGKHGRTAAELQEMFTKQNGLCAACEEAESSKINGVSRSLSVDHDHDHCDGSQSCGECVRELLCSRCNHVIGFAKDSVPVLEHCIEYLVKWDKTGERLPQLLAWAHEIIERYES